MNFKGLFTPLQLLHLVTASFFLFVQSSSFQLVRVSWRLSLVVFVVSLLEVLMAASLRWEPSGFHSVLHVV